MTIIQRHNGETINLDEAGIRTRDFIISSPNPVNVFEPIQGAMGVVDYGTTIGPREIRVYFRATSYDIDDFSLLRDEIFHIFRNEESFYLIEHREPGKRWLVKVQDPYSIPQRNIFGNFEISFIGLKGVAESIGTTQIIQQNGINANDELWGYGMGLIADDDSLRYTHGSRTFRIYNAGNVPVHPFEQDLKIKILNAFSSTSFFELKNLTNGSFFRLNEGLANDKELVIDGPKVEIDGLNALDDTEHEFIELNPGWNEFEINGATTARTEFDFRFYYK